MFNAKGTRPPSFWVPGSYGFVESFISLASALGPDYPVYSFRARGNDGKRMPFARLEEMAAYYADQVKAIHPRGPYVLGGYSYGGLVALEMAQILARRGLRVGKLVLLDAYPPTEPIYRIMRDPKHNFEIKLVLANYLTGHGEWSQVIQREDLDGVPPRLHLAHLASLVAERGRTRMSRDDIFAYLQGATEVSEYAAESYATYRPSPYDASDVLYFRSQEGADDYIGGYDYVRPWEDIVRSRLRVIACPVKHADMTGERALEIILGPLKAALSEHEVRVAAPAAELS
ncbi:hypothetical protein BE18_24605 [Sorangium cellulosum]|uniref:Thioesterase TesA-like domain-containing protein n=1 Tax=Sorangium cellulosum TaxID=56 RepID=A0A150RWN2_SORCE|nr:hypothetical protein BE18_24605 [Sorangium cellulosum]